MWDTTNLNVFVYRSENLQVYSGGIPHLAKEVRYPEFPARGAGESCVCAFL
jgi:hypothetical protein